MKFIENIGLSAIKCFENLARLPALQPQRIIILMTTCSLEYSNHIERANHKPRFNIKQGMLAWRLKESNTGEHMHNSEKNKLNKLKLECINRQYVL